MIDRILFSHEEYVTLSFTAKWVELKDIVSNEINSTKRDDNPCSFLHVGDK